MCGDGGGLVESRVSCILLSGILVGWLVGGVLVVFLNGIIMEFSISSIGVLFGT